MICGDPRFAWSDMRWFKDNIMLICGDLRFLGRPVHNATGSTASGLRFFKFLKVFFRFFLGFLGF